jgi:hypothetical protein
MFTSEGGTSVGENYHSHIETSPTDVHIIISHSDRSPNDTRHYIPFRQKSQSTCHVPFQQKSHRCMCHCIPFKQKSHWCTCHHVPFWQIPKDMACPIQTKVPQMCMSLYPFQTDMSCPIQMEVPQMYMSSYPIQTEVPLMHVIISHFERNPTDWHVTFHLNRSPTYIHFITSPLKIRKFCSCCLNHRNSTTWTSSSTMNTDFRGLSLTVQRYLNTAKQFRLFIGCWRTSVCIACGWTLTSRVNSMTASSCCTIWPLIHCACQWGCSNILLKPLLNTVLYSYCCITTEGPQIHVQWQCAGGCLQGFRQQAKEFFTD